MKTLTWPLFAATLSLSVLSSPDAWAQHKASPMRVNKPTASAPLVTSKATKYSKKAARSIGTLLDISPDPSLTLDTTEIVITDDTCTRLTVSADILTVLATEGIVTDDVTPLPFNCYHYVALKNPVDAVLLIHRLATNMKNGYVAPIYRDASGSPTIATREFFVTLKQTASDADVVAFMKSIDADELNLMTRQKVTVSENNPTDMPSPPDALGKNASASIASLSRRRSFFMQWRVRDGFDALARTKALRSNPIVESAVSNFIGQGQPYSETLNAPDYITAPYVPSRQQFNIGASDYYLYGSFGINAPSAWGYTPGSASVLVAVFDNGSNTGAGSASGTYHHAQSDILQVPGYDTTTSPPTVGGQHVDGDGENHGTWVAGFINGVTNREPDNAHTASPYIYTEFGVAPACPVMPFRCYDNSELDDDAGITAAIIYAQRNGVRVSNNSTGIHNPTANSPVATHFAFRQSQANGMAHFAASGNIDPKKPTPQYMGYAQNWPSLYAVGATDINGDIAPFSIYDNGIAFCAPGVSLQMPDLSGPPYYYNSPGQNDVRNNGTSYSSPIAAGIAALVISANPALNTDDVFQIMRATAHPNGASTAWDTSYGWGRVDAGAAVERATHFVATDMCIDANSNKWILSTGFEHRQGFPAQGTARINVVNPSGQVTMSMTLTIFPGWTPRYITVGGDGNARLFWTHERDQELIHTITPSGGVIATYTSSTDTTWRPLAFVAAPNNSYFALWTTSAGWYYVQHISSDFSSTSGTYIVDPVNSGSPIYDPHALVNDLAYNPSNGQVSVLKNDMTTGQAMIYTYAYLSNGTFQSIDTQPVSTDGALYYNATNGFNSAAKLRIGPDGVYNVLFTATDGSASVESYTRMGTSLSHTGTPATFAQGSYTTTTGTGKYVSYSNLPGPNFMQSVKAMGLTPSGVASLMANNLTAETTMLDGVPYTSDNFDSSYGARYWTGTQMSSFTGQVDTDGRGRVAVSGVDSAQYLVYGPYTTQVTADRHRIHWLMSIDNNGGGSSPVFTDRVMTLQILDSYDNTLLSTRDIYRYDFLANNTLQDFAQGFTLPASRAGHALSFQAYWYGNATNHISQVGIDGMEWTSQDSQIHHVIGSADGDGWSAPAGTSGNFLSYGPYDLNIQTGPQIATYDISVYNSSGNAAPGSSTTPIAYVDVNDSDTNTVLAQLPIAPADFRSSNTYQKFRLPFQMPVSSFGHHIEFRVFDYGTMGLKYRAVGISTPVQ